LKTMITCIGLKKRQRLASPKQARQRHRVSAPISALLANPTKHHRAVGRPTRGHDAPPVGKQIDRRRQVTLGSNQSGPVHHPSVGFDLTWESLKRVGLGLDFNATDVAVDHRDIDARSAVRQAKLVQDQSVGAGACVR